MATPVDFSNYLPPEVWEHVLSFVDVRSVLAGVSLVSRRFHALASEPHLWRHLLLSHFAATSSAAASRLGTTTDTATTTTTNLYAGDAEHGWRKTFFAHRWLAHSKRVRFCLMGHVDCGKSTLLGRILESLGSVSQQEVERCREQVSWTGKLSYQFAWLTDRSKDERERGVTLDWCARECALPSGREIELVGVPGYRYQLQNAVTGASMADVAILVVHAGLGQFEAGVNVHDHYPGGTRTHLILAKRLGMSRVVVVVNGMDSYAANYSQRRYREIEDAVLELAAEVGYEGPTLVEVMEQVAQALTTGAAACREVAKRPLFGPTRVSVLRRVNALCIAGAPKGEVVVEALVQSGTVREGQVLHARLSAPIANRARDGPQPASALVTLAVVSILRLDKPREAQKCVRSQNPGRSRREIEDAVLELAAEVGYEGPTLVEVMEQVAQALTTGAAACREVAKRPLFGPTRVSVLRRVNALCIAGAPKGEVVVEALVQSGTVREGQVLHARLPAPIANRARDGSVGTQPASALVTLAVVSILRFDKPRVEQVIKCWNEEGQEEKVEDGEGAQAGVKVRKGVITLVLIKPLGYVHVEPFERNAVLGTVLLIDHLHIQASGQIVSITQR
ncbi:elongation factor Tu GTP binding domain containing protein [Acanthamoeba castellanii str. Neff]|uniref:Elongation factor Tu GTP binding domain containing protein n=1 Tax=Acanthamoeba castellanii (strain ATCC 30010 / Neff) TaxID=1257118 RepID=L8H3A4_ACACF|nr:elongation factor Tu GTP binding domain containing protein [Acanthamoeba castellanii str. Neff]ELR18901.1 elongation factor Tu GTP binding domain containing protein [Acanthamoeba castellanii str. Neff]